MGSIFRFAAIISVLAGSFCAAPGFACDTSPDLMRIPGSTDAEHEARYQAYERVLGIVKALEAEKGAIENSWSVYLGKVAAVVAKPGKSESRTFSVKPVWQVRGRLPTEAAILERGGQASCSIPGDIWGLKSGDLVVVFDMPGSKSAWRADQVRSSELIDAIDMYALSLEKKAP